ncbi:acyloxyacyl hydrolase [Pleionea litopenaei]|uniref:Acyloxyacyl hydrolase n=1 Tax=Pleionea litopenaei TaxID=3070815 RepID=A0AA51X5B7_9GAMM|nr:acyloxyacyl hydrolase [Pleionea sp. HL-JVS1]WMS85703.1 acyloxyacyl hydrolase [Pleionea sp. HL-JVS1]
MKAKLLAAIILVTIRFSWADIAVMASYGVGMDDELIQSGSTSGSNVTGIGVRYPWLFDQTLPHLGHFDVSIDAEWHRMSSEFQQQSEDLTMWAIKPTLQWYWQDDKSHVTELGVGIGRISERQYQEITTSSNYQFAIHLGYGWRFGENRQWQTMFRYNHYSNGYLARPNPGIDFLSLALYYQF